MEQLSTDWFEWRAKGIGSSDVATILGLSPYQTPLQLYRVKVGLDEQVVDNAATYRGRKFEPKARACFELSSFKEYEPKLFQSIQYPFMRVSLDGWCDAEREILEIKCPGAETLALAKEGKLPPHYYAQVQYQLFVADGTKAIYFAFDPDSEKGFEVEVLPDEDYLKAAIPQVVEFWMRVQRKEPPQPTDRDWLAMPESLAPLIELYKVQHALKLQREIEATRQAIFSQMPHPRLRGYGVKIYPHRSRKGDTFRIALEKGEGEVLPSP